MLLPLLVGIVVAAPMAAVPTDTLWTLDHDRLSPAQQVLAQTLQGLVGTPTPRIWLITKGASAVVLDQLRQGGTPIEPAADVWSLVKRFRKNVKGAILYKLGTPALNVATGLCGPMKAVAVDESLEQDAKTNGLPVLLDVRGMSDQQAYARFHDLYAKGTVVEQSIDKPGQLRDYAVKHSAFVMDTRDREFRKKVVREAGPNALVFGWGPDEYEWISDLSSGGGTSAPSDWCINLSALESLKTGPLRPRTDPSIESEDGVRYVAFVLSDGDNVQWTTGEFIDDPKFYGSPLRGDFPMTWEVSELLSHLAPRVLQNIYTRAKRNDSFVTGAGLPGYEYPHLQPDRASTAKRSEPYLRDSGLKVVSILNTNDGSLSDAFPWLELPEVDGAIYKDYAPYNRRQGEIAWHNGKPCMAYRFLLWENLMGADDLVAAIGKMPTSPLKTSNSYALINVHAWSFGNQGGPIQAVKQVIDHLPPNTRVITAPQLIQLLKKNHPMS